MREAARILLEWIPIYYDTPRVQRIIKPDGQVNQVITHKGDDQRQDAESMAETQAIQNIYDLSQGTFDVTISVGPSYQTKRQEAVATQMELIKADPKILGVIGDLLVRNMDIPGAKEIADRLHAILPPAVLAADDPQKQGQALQGQITNMQAQLQQAGMLLKQQHDIIQGKQVEQAGKVQIAQLQEQSKQAIVKMQEATKLAVAQINASKDANQSFAELELDQYKIMHQGAHDIAMQQHQQAHDKMMAQQAAQQAQQSQQADQEHEAGMAQFAAANQPQNGAQQ